MTSTDLGGQFEAQTFQIQTGAGATNFDVETDGGFIAVNVDGGTPVYVNGTLVYTNKVFVYGTLMPGMERWDGVMETLAETIQPALVQGKLFDTGHGYPVAAFNDADDEDGCIPGWVVTIKPALVDQAIMLLDQIEHTADDLYRRIPLYVDEHACWAYHWPWSTANFNRINQWVKQEKKEATA